jgi:hypothetical protein
MDDPCEVSPEVIPEADNAPSAPPSLPTVPPQAPYAVPQQFGEQQLQYQQQMQAHTLYQQQQQQMQYHPYHYQQSQQQQQQTHQQLHQYGNQVSPSSFSSMSPKDPVRARNDLCLCCATLDWPCSSIASFYCMIMLCVVTLVLSIVAACGSGDIFFAGWSGGPGGGSGSSFSTKDYRLTLHYETSCDADAGDTFCTEFFADTLVALPTLPGGGELVAQNVKIQSTFGVSAFVILAIFFRLIVLKCQSRSCHFAGLSLPRSEEAADAPQQNAQYRAFHALNFVFHLAIGVPCTYALLSYAGAAENFMGLQNPPIREWSVEGGFRCGLAVIAFHGLAALCDAYIACTLRCCPPHMQTGGSYPYPSIPSVAVGGLDAQQDASRAKPLL